MDSINSVVLTGNLTRDPELRQLASGTSVGTLRLAFNERFKSKDTGEWSERPNYISVTVWSGLAENCARYLSKGSGVVVQGRLRWREWQADDGGKRSEIDITAEKVRFMGGPGGSRNGGDEGRYDEQYAPHGGSGDFTPQGDGDSDFSPAPAGGGYTPQPVPKDEDDIPFAWIDQFDVLAM